MDFGATHMKSLDQIMGTNHHAGGYSIVLVMTLLTLIVFMLQINRLGQYKLNVIQNNYDDDIIIITEKYINIHH